jgi:hypothetical protein
MIRRSEAGTFDSAMKALAFTTLPTPCHSNSAVPRIKLNTGQLYAQDGVEHVSILLLVRERVFGTTASLALLESVESVLPDDSSVRLSSEPVTLLSDGSLDWLSNSETVMLLSDGSTTDDSYRAAGVRDVNARLMRCS